MEFCRICFGMIVLDPTIGFGPLEFWRTFHAFLLPRRSSVLAPDKLRAKLNWNKVRVEMITILIEAIILKIILIIIDVLLNPAWVIGFIWPRIGRGKKCSLGWLVSKISPKIGLLCLLSKQQFWVQNWVSGTWQNSRLGRLASKSARLSDWCLPLVYTTPRFRCNFKPLQCTVFGVVCTVHFTVSAV